MKPDHPLRRIAGACLVALVLAGCSVTTSESERLASARKFRAQGDATSAFLQVKSILQARPESGAGRYLLGLLLIDQGAPAEAEIELRRAMDVKYLPDEVTPALARALSARLKYRKVVDEFGQLQLTDPKANNDLKALVGTAYAMLGQKDQARRIVDAVKATAPQHTETLLLEAKLLVSGGEAEAGVTRMNALVALDPGSATAWQFLGDLRMFAKSDIPGAADAYRQVVAISPRNAQAQGSLVAIALHQRDIKGATAQIEAMRKVLPQHPQTKLFEAQLAFLSNDLGKSRDVCLNLLRSFPENLSVLQLAGMTELQRGGLVQAETYLSKAMSLSPELALPRRLLAQVYLRMGQPTKALSVIRPSIERSGGSADTLETAAEVYLNLGDSATAESLYVRAAKLRPDDPKIKTALALAQFAKGEDQTALITLEAIAATDKEGTVADLALISTRLRRNETALALKAIEVLAQKAPDSPAPSNLRGRVLVERGDFAEARRNFEAALLKDPAFVAAAASLANLDLRDRKPAEAQKRFEDVLKANPRRTEASLALAELRLQGGAKRTDVTPVYEAAVKASSGDASARVALVNHLLAANESKAALSAAQQGASAMPGTPEVLDALGRAQQVTGEPNQALATFGKLAVLIPKSPQPHIHSANVHLANKNPVVALLSLRRALEIDPRSTEAQRLLISVALSLKRPQDALDVAKSMQLQLPRDAVGFAFAGDIEAEQGRWDRAAVAYQQGVGKANAGNLPNRLHLALKAAKQSVAAERFAEQWMKDHPRDSGFQFYLGDAAMADGQLVLAESRYEKVLAIQPQNAFALNNMAYLRLLQKKPGGRALAEKACAMLPDNPSLIDTLSMALADEGDLKAAIVMSQKALALAPTDPNIRFNLARLFMLSGDNANAKLELETLAQLGTKFRKHTEVTTLLKKLA